MELIAREVDPGVVATAGPRYFGYVTGGALPAARVADLVDGCCSRAHELAAQISNLPRCTVLNDVVINQVLFRFADDETTQAVLASVQASGEAWMGETMWDGRPAIRVSVSNWRTTQDDIRRTVAAFEHALADSG